MLIGAVTKPFEFITAALMVKSGFIDPGMPPPDDPRAALPQSGPFQKEPYYPDEGSLRGKLNNEMLAP